MADAASQQAQAQAQALAAAQAGRAEALSGGAQQGQGQHVGQSAGGAGVHETQGQSIRKSLEQGIEGPSTLDPRFDRDDLRQGHPPPAVRQHLKALRKMRRPRKLKGTPFRRNKAKEESEGVDEADMTDEEVEVTDEEAEAAAIAAHKEGDEGNKSGGGILAKVLGK